jgi:hypothetical protein
MSGATDVSAGPGAQIFLAAAANPVDVAIRLRARKALTSPRLRQSDRLCILDGKPSEVR